MNNQILAQFSYNPDTGVITGVRSRPIGHFDDKGYLRVNLGKGHGYIRAHRLAWFLMTSELPDGDIDHINRIKHDNKWSNLRIATCSENASNADVRPDNKHGIKGVCFETRDKFFLVQISIAGIRTVVGRYKDFFEACCARKSAENRSGVIF
jgi:hypothetical protein